MKLHGQDERPVVVEFTQDEARRFKESLMDDVIWDDTSETRLYSDLYGVLSEGLE